MLRLLEQIESLERVKEERAGFLKQTQILITIPGVGYFTALTIFAELGETDRSNRDKEIVSYVGWNPVIRESGDSRFEGGISAGIGTRRWLLVQAPYAAVHTCNDVPADF
jgi:transposase